MKLDCLLIYVPKLDNYYKLVGRHIFGMYMPMGLPAIADSVYANGYKVRMLHLGVEKIANPHFSLKEYLKETKPEIVGLSLHWYFQSYDVIETAREIKSISPGTFIVLGGFTASYFHEEIMKEFCFIDGIIRGDGEFPFLKLTQAIKSGGSNFSDIPNLAWRDKYGIIVNEISYLAGSEELDSLNFTNLNLLEKYELYIQYARFGWRWVTGLSKEINLLALDKRKVFPLSISRGCFVNCSFCGGGQLSQYILSKRNGVAFRSINKVIGSIREAKIYGYDTIFIECSPNSAGNFSYFEELFKEIKIKKIEINCIAECMALPSGGFIRQFKEAFTCISKSQISISLDSSCEENRKLNKGYYFSNKELIDNINQVVGLGIPVDVFFAIGLPFDTLDTLIATKNFQDLLRKNFGCTLTVRTECLDLDPASPMYINPGKYKIVKNWNCFMDYYQANGDKSCLFSNTISGYYQENFFKTNGATSLIQAKEFKNGIGKIVCNNFCRLADLFYARLKNKSLRLPVKVGYFLCNLVCVFSSCLWKLRRAVEGSHTSAKSNHCSDCNLFNNNHPSRRATT